MKNRNLYRLEFIDKECIQVIRVDNNYGVQGYVYKDGRIRKAYTPYSIPNYIVAECMDMFNGNGLQINTVAI